MEPATLLFMLLFTGGVTTQSDIISWQEASSHVEVSPVVGDTSDTKLQTPDFGNMLHTLCVCVCVCVFMYQFQ